MRDKLKRGLTIVAEGAEASADNGATLGVMPNRRLSGVFGAAIIVQSHVEARVVSQMSWTFSWAPLIGDFALTISARIRRTESSSGWLILGLLGLNLREMTRHIVWRVFREKFDDTVKFQKCSQKPCHFGHFLGKAQDTSFCIPCRPIRRSAKPSHRRPAPNRVPRLSCE